jgi:LysM repeat protein
VADATTLNSRRGRAHQPRALVTLVALGALVTAGSAASYTVRSGDTLARVARRHGVSVEALAKANGIRDIHRIVVGAHLVIPGVDPAPAAAVATTSYTVQAGDTLERIARRFGTTVTVLARANRLADVHVVRLGRVLTVPAGATAAGPAVSRTGLPDRLRSSPDRLALMPRFDHWARTYGVPADLLKAMTWVESGWQSARVSRTGAVGIGQLMPATVDFVSDVLLRTPLNVREPDHNIRMSARFLRYLLDQNGGRADRALASYYQGLRSVRERGIFAETRVYVGAILAWQPRFR